MPARFTLTKLPEGYVLDGFKPRFNIGPSQYVVVLIGGELRFAKFGFRRDFTKNALINVRSEGIVENKVFSDAFLHCRCVVLVDSFYEWEDKDGEKVPYRILLKDESVFGMAGVYEEKDGDLFVSVFTCEPNDLVDKVHPRMPVILKNDDWEKWLKVANLEGLEGYDASEMMMYMVSKRVNNIRNDNEELIKEYKQKSLFGY